MYGESETYFQCPYCFEQISMVFEVFHGDQSYIEDCEVCCGPIEVRYSCEEGKVKNLVADRAQ